MSLQQQRGPLEWFFYLSIFKLESLNFNFENLNLLEHRTAGMALQEQLVVLEGLYSLFVLLVLSGFVGSCTPVIPVV